MKPKCNLGHERPKVCVQTVFGLNLEKRGKDVFIHGNLQKKEGGA